MTDAETIQAVRTRQKYCRAHPDDRDCEGCVIRNLCNDWGLSLWSLPNKEEKEMTPVQQEKYKRMQDRVNELAGLNEKIAKLAFYIKENEISDDYARVLKAQRSAMIQYRDILQERIVNGAY